MPVVEFIRKQSSFCTSLVVIWPFLILVFFGILVFGWASQRSYTFHVPGSSYATIAILIGCSLACNITGYFKSISNMAYYTAIWLSYNLIGAVFTYLMGTLRLPLLDENFAQMDAALGFYWMDWYNFLNAFPLANRMLEGIYIFCVFEIFISIILLSAIGKTERLDDFLWTCVISGLITSILSGVFPALGAFEYFGVELDRAKHLPDLLALRDGSITAFAFSKMQGIVTFPSYHTVLAILFIYIFRGIYLVFEVSVILNALMLISIPSMGGHYLVDMIAGGIVAAFAIYLVQRMKDYSSDKAFDWLSWRTAR